MAEYFNVTTNLGDAEVANAIATNTKIEVTHIAFGDGNGSVPTPLKTRTTLVREVHRQAVTKYERHKTNPNWIVIETVIPSHIGGFTVREIGVIGNGKLISHGNHAPFEKVADPTGVSEYRLKFTQNITDGNVVSITLDESLIFATQAWVEENYIKRSEIVDDLTTNEHEKPLSAAMGKKLQDEKVNKTDIVDDLATDDESKPVSAKQAKKLQDEKVGKLDTIALNHGGTGATTAAAARSNLGLGTAAVLNSGILIGNIPTMESTGIGGFGIGLRNSSVQGYESLNVPDLPVGAGQVLATAPGVPNQNGTTTFFTMMSGVYGWRFGHPNVDQHIYAQVCNNGAWRSWGKLYTTQNTTVNSNGVLVPSSPVIQIHADQFVLNDDARTLKSECVKVEIGHYEISNVDGFHQDGWYINTPTDKNQNPLIAVDYEFDATQRKITIHSYAVKPGVFPFEPDLTSPLDAPEGRWIDIRLYEPEWLTNPELPPVSEIIKDKNGNIAPSIYHYLENKEWLISEDDALILAQEKRSLLPKLSKRQFALYMYDHQMYDQVMQAIEANPRFKIEYDAVSDIERLSPTVSEMTSLLGWTEDQVDQMWTEALTL